MSFSSSIDHGQVVSRSSSHLVLSGAQIYVVLRESKCDTRPTILATCSVARSPSPGNLGIEVEHEEGDEMRRDA